MILVNFDLDAICACKILQTLFRCDSIIYSIVPVRGVSDLKKAYDENSAEVNCFILINCGGTIDILEVLEPEENVIFYIIDSHRPIDVCNIYSNKQICVLGDPVDDVPEFDDIFRDDVSISYPSLSEILPLRGSVTLYKLPKFHVSGVPTC